MVITDDNSGTKESVYSAKDLGLAGRVRFGVPPEVVIAALQSAAREEATLNEAYNIIKDFVEREVM